MDAAPDAVSDVAIEVQSRTRGGLRAGDPIETGSIPAAVPCVIVLPVQVSQEVQAAYDNSGCSAGNCRVGDRAEADDTSTCKSGCDSLPTRRLRPLRNLFRRGR